MLAVRGWKFKAKDKPKEDKRKTLGAMVTFAAWERKMKLDGGGILRE